MSNRPRRRLLREWRMHAFVWWGDSPPDTIQTLEEWNRWHRVRYLWREPLRFPNNIRPDAGLINIQARNEAEPFNPLTDPIPEPPAHQMESWDLKELWGRIETAIDSALHYLAPARTITRPCFIPGYGDMYLVEDYPARFYRGFRKLRDRMFTVHQHGDDGNPWFPDHGSAARNILNLDERITEPELYALLVLAACYRALNELGRLPESWSREDLDYIDGKVQDAERWLAEAYRLKQWAGDSHRAKSAKGGKAEKGSRGVRLLALALREEKPSASAEALFNVAVSRAGDKNKPLLADAYIIRTNAEAKQLFSTDPDGKPDGLPVGLSGWLGFAPPRRVKKS